MLEHILNKTQQDKLKKIGLILLTIFLAYLAADLFILVIKTRLKTPLEMPVFAQGQLNQVKIKTQEEYIRDLRALFPFKSTAEDASAELINPQLELSSALLSGNLDNVKLVGTLISDDVSLAIIQIADKSVAISEGRVVGDYTLTKVTKSSVIFTGKDDKKVLYMVYNRGQSAGSSNLPKTSSGEISSRKILDRQELLSLIEPPERLVRDVHTIPIQKGGQPYGIRLAFVNPSSLFYKMGLRKGDILININNRDLKSSEDFVTAYQILRNEDHIALRLDRESKIYNISFDIR